MATSVPDPVTMETVWDVALTTNNYPSGSLNPDFSDSNETWDLPTKAPNTMHLEYIGYVFVPLFLIVGVTGNILTMVIMRSRYYKKLPVSYILIALSFSDTILNLLLPFNKMFVRKLLGVDIRSFSDPGCKTFYWSFRMAKMTSSWLVVFICIERFIAVRFPLHASVWITRRHALYGIAFIYGFLGAYIGYWVSFADRLLPNGVCVPNTRPPGLVEKSRAFLVIGLTMYSFAPALVLICLNYVIISTLLKARRHRQKYAVLFKDETHKTTGMLITINIAFMILVLPIACGHLVLHIQDRNIFEARDKPTVIFREIAQVMEQMNYSINFFLYVLSSQSYRKKLMVVFKLREESTFEKSSSPWVSAQNINLSTPRKISVGSLASNQIRRISTTPNVTPMLARAQLIEDAASKAASGDPLLRRPEVNRIV